MEIPSGPVNYLRPTVVAGRGDIMRASPGAVHGGKKAERPQSFISHLGGDSTRPRGHVPGAPARINNETSKSEDSSLLGVEGGAGAASDG